MCHPADITPRPRPGDVLPPHWGDRWGGIFWGYTGWSSTTGIAAHPRFGIMSATLVGCPLGRTPRTGFRPSCPFAQFAHLFKFHPSRSFSGAQVAQSRVIQTEPSWRHRSTRSNERLIFKSSRKSEANHPSFMMTATTLAGTWSSLVPPTPRVCACSRSDYLDGISSLPQ